MVATIRVPGGRLFWVLISVVPVGRLMSVMILLFSGLVLARIL